MSDPFQALNNQKFNSCLECAKSIYIHWTFKSSLTTADSLFFLLLILFDRCANGYTKNSETDECDDINECDTGEANCDGNNQACLNTIGSYKCLDILNSEKSNNCEEGFRYQARIDQCVGNLSFKTFSRYFKVFKLIKHYAFHFFNVFLFCIFSIFFALPCTRCQLLNFIFKTSTNVRKAPMIAIVKLNYVWTRVAAISVKRKSVTNA
jgi:hypothetical protein